MSRSVLVTGGNRGIGLAIATAFREAGDQVAVTYNSSPPPEGFFGVKCDITDQEQVDAAFDAIQEQQGPVEVLVANAGAGQSSRLDRTTDADWQRMLDLNLTAPFRCLRRAVPAMRQAGWGRIVVVASTAALVGEPYIAAYTASKHGVLGLVRSAAAELARTGVTVNAVCPAYVDSPMTDQTVATIATTTGRTPEEARRILERKQPIGRLITPDEVADAIWFCIGNAAVTGQAVKVDGGL